MKKRMKSKFFKPNLLKIVVALVIFVAFAFIHIIPCLQYPGDLTPDNTSPEPELTFCPANPSLTYFRRLSGIISIDYLGISGIFGFILAFMISLGLSYIIACLFSLIIKKE